MTIIEKEAKKAKEDFELHVRLLMRTGLKVGEARVAAWMAGPSGLGKLLAKLD